MRDFFILWMERIINVVVVIGAVVVLIAAVTVMFNAQGGFLAGVVYLG